jgi:hypothetical protein
MSHLPPAAEPAPAPGQVPAGLGLLAWDGIGVFIPCDWSIGRHEGDSLFGSLRVDGAEQVMLRVRWWQAPKRFHLDNVAMQFQRSLVNQARSQRKGAPGATAAEQEGQAADPKDIVVVPTTRVKLPTRLGDQAQAFVSGAAMRRGVEPSKVSNILVAAYRRDLKRAAVWQFIVGRDGPSFEQINRMVSGLMIQGLEQWRDWQVLDMAFQAPPASRLDKAVLASGVCYFRFEWRRTRVGLRRFSAANAVMDRLEPQEEDLVRWCRGAYANEFFDLRYRIESKAIDTDHHALILKGRKRLLAPLEMRWVMARHRKLPRQIEIYWDKPANKICCFEIAKLTGGNEAIIRQMVKSYRPVLDEPPPAATLAQRGEAPRTPRQRSLAARIRRSRDVTWHLNDHDRVVLQYEHVRPLGLRLLRLLAQQPTTSREMRKVELDLIGSIIWQACDGKTRVRDIIEHVHREFRISPREAEVSVTEYVKTLGNRGWILLEMPPK